MSAKFPVYKDEFLYLTTTGRKTGQPHEIEIWFVPHEGCYYLCAEHREGAAWVKNIRQEGRVRFWVNGTAYDGSARPVDPAAEPALQGAVAARFDAKYQWSDGLLVELRPLGTAAS